MLLFVRENRQGLFLCQAQPPRRRPLPLAASGSITFQVSNTFIKPGLIYIPGSLTASIFFCIPISRQEIQPMAALLFGVWCCVTPFPFVLLWLLPPSSFAEDTCCITASPCLPPNVGSPLSYPDVPICFTTGTSLHRIWHSFLWYLCPYPSKREPYVTLCLSAGIPFSSDMTIELSLRASWHSAGVSLSSSIMPPTLRNPFVLIFHILFSGRCHNYFLCKVTGATILQGTCTLFPDFFIKIFSLAGRNFLLASPYGR